MSASSFPVLCVPAHYPPQNPKLACLGQAFHFPGRLSAAWMVNQQTLHAHMGKLFDVEGIQRLPRTGQQRPSQGLLP